MGFDVSGRRVLVTGASSGIGAGLAEGFARSGAVVGICARRKDRLAEVLERCRQYSPESRMWVCDLADPAAVVWDFTISDGKIVHIDMLAASDSLDRIDLTVLDG